MELMNLIEDVSRQRLHLEILKADPGINTDSLEKCDALLNGIAYSLDELISTAWIPTEPATLKTLLTRTVENINGAHDAVNDGILSVDPSKADHLLRLKLGLLCVDTLDFMLEMLVAALARTPEMVN